ncbi:SGNH/GDSL hydrolase family protein [Streptomyces tauricus]|uniref:GDSL-type esterase/lipase family protein n=1 Tax=Streptomyces tauricus TaxID=68274 RepID=UPI002243ABD0|nr:GDSL-type esterase/lipase family protein [Streptomyces tauricus]MCW8098460.1 GDSL-type esterase/lipase family protein [Streptomyces tauricus]
MRTTWVRGRGRARCRRRIAVATAAVAALCGAGLTQGGTVHAQGKAAETPWVVSLGDSFISGEAGRWSGNSNDSAGGYSGTDRAFDQPSRTTDEHRVYGASYDNGCNRSDSAEVHSSPAPAGAHRLNLACSGATSTAILLPEHGGRPFKSEPSQAEQLQKAVTGHPVRAVVVSVGGNDLGFEDVIVACAKGFVTPIGASPCAPTQAPEVKKRLPAMRAAAVNSLADVTTAMNRAGHPAGSYRLILQSYPSPLPDGARIRYPGDKYDRLTDGGCPFFDKDLTWAHDQLVPDISSTLASAARESGAEFLDLSRAFDGREVCSTTTVQAGPRERPSGRTSEWVRFVTTGAGQGQRQESLHPNHYGQLALGACLSLHLTGTPGDRRCTNAPGEGPRAMRLSPAPKN